MRIGFVGESYTAGSTSVADEEAINLFPQSVESQAEIVPNKAYGGESAAGLKAYFGTPGLSIFSADTNGGPYRGNWWTGSRLFGVDGDTLYEVSSTGVRTAIGYVGSDGKPVSMVNNVNQLFIVSNGQAYCYTLAPGQWAANTAFTVDALILDGAGHIQKAIAAAWAASTVYSVGAEIVDGNGNVQKASQAQWSAATVYALNAAIVDGAGHIQEATQAAWTAGTTYVLGAEIVDAEGNLQKAYAYAWVANTVYALGFQLVDSNGNIQQVTTAGTSGSAVPVWATSSTTTDGTTLVWTYQASAAGNAGTSGTTVPVWAVDGATADVTGSTLFWFYEGSAAGNAGTSGAAIPIFNDAGGTAPDGTGTLVWSDQGLAVNAGTSGTAVPVFGTATTSDNGTLVWIYQSASNGSAGTSGATIPAFNDTLGTTPDGSGTLVWQDKGLQLLNVTPQLAGAPLRADYSDSYFVVMFANSNRFQTSQLLDGTIWPGLLISEVEVFADNIVSILCNHREPWIFGTWRSQPYQDTGSAEVFDVIPGTMIEKGCAATFVPCRLDNSLFWVDQDERGALSAWRSNGYTPQRISTYAVETDLGTNTLANIQAMTSYAYVDAGHIFWILYVPGSNWSWCYDVVEGLWHKRASWNTESGTWGPHASWNHTYAFGMHLVGDWATGNLYQVSMGTYKDNGNMIRRLRRTPTIINEMARIYHAELTVDFDMGLGPQPPLTDGEGNPRPPQAVLRFSDNRGRTWSNQHVRGLGLAGEYNARAIWRRLGNSRYRVYELVITDAFPVAIVDAYLRLGQGATQA